MTCRISPARMETRHCELRNRSWLGELAASRPMWAAVLACLTLVTLHIHASSYVFWRLPRPREEWTAVERFLRAGPWACWLEPIQFVLLLFAGYMLIERSYVWIRRFWDKSGHDSASFRSRMIESIPRAPVFLVASLFAAITNHLSPLTPFQPLHMVLNMLHTNMPRIRLPAVFGSNRWIRPVGFAQWAASLPSSLSSRTCRAGGAFEQRWTLG